MSQDSSEVRVQFGEASPSPAREALRGTLDGNLTLMKKKSWFGSLRDAVQKGALQAKAAVDSFRGEPSRNDSAFHEVPSSPLELRQSIDSLGTDTPSKRRYEIPFPHNSAISSLRSHLRHPSRHKRVSVHTISSRPSDDLSSIERPEKSPAEKADNYAAIKHNRNTSITSSLAGSFRNIGRKSGLSRPSAAPIDLQSPGKTATKVPLPSSPIDIPAAAPALSLDLGPTNFMPPVFNPSPKVIRTQEIKILKDPANITSARPTVHGFHDPDMNAPSAFRFPLKSRRFPVTPSTSLQKSLPKEFSIDQPDGPPTPMPGTTFQLEVDGHVSEPSEVFERGVEPKSDASKSGGRGLRHMRSLDAMAEACKVAHRNDDVAVAAQQQHDEEQKKFKETYLSPVPLTSIREERTVSSASTVTACDAPSNMEELSRQPSEPIPVARRQTPDHDNSEEYNSVIPVATSGPPSPTRSVELPLRLKNGLGPAEERGGSPKVSPAGLTSTRRRSASPIVFLPFLDKAAARELGINRKSASPTTSPLSGQPCQSTKKEYKPIEPEAPQKEVQAETYYDSPVPLNLMDHTEAHVRASQSAQDDSESVLTDYEEFKTQQLFNDNYDFPISSPTSSQAAGFIPQLYSRISGPPSSVSSPVSRSSDVRDVLWRLSVNNWLGQYSETRSEASSVRRARNMDPSIDSVTDTVRSPTSPTPGNDAELSMGNRAEFNQRQSQRNMRYNALENISSTELTTAEFGYNPHDFVPDSDGLTKEYAGSQDSTPQRRNNDASESRDSIAASLRYAMMATNTLQANLDIPEQNDSHLAGDKTPTSGSPNTIDAVFSPTSPRKHSWTNRFEILTDDQNSSPVGSPPTDEESPNPLPRGERLTTDSLDEDIKLFNSPASGYNADMSSNTPESPSKMKTPPARYKRSGIRAALSPVSRNVV